MTRKRTAKCFGALNRLCGTDTPLCFFPFVGKCYEGAYVHDGKEYGMTPHGFARDMDFEPLLCDMDECWFRLKGHAGDI